MFFAINVLQLYGFVISQVLPVINRAQIIDDTFNLARYAERLRSFW